MTVSAEEAAFAPIGAWRDYDDYRGALVLPIDREGRVLLQLRDHRARIHPGEWGLFGGGVEAGETLRAAAAREFAEETGLAVDPAAFRPFARQVAPHTGARLYLFELAFAGGPGDIRLGEGAGFGFIEPEDLPRLRTLAATKIFLAAWARARRGP